MSFEVRQHAGRVSIPADVDRKYRAWLLQRVPSQLHDRMSDVLSNGPSRAGAAEAQRYFGAELQTVLLGTVALIETLEMECQGIWRWFNVTGFGNDKDMIRLMSEWGDLNATADKGSLILQ